MASTSEKGHAKNIANANLLSRHILELGVLYNPTNPKLLLSNLQSIYTNSAQHQNQINELIPPYSNAVNEREKIFAAQSKKITKLQKAYKATEGVTSAQLENFMTIARKLKGARKISIIQTTDTSLEKKQHSISQMSYDQRTNNYDLLIAQFQNTPNYNPNETDYQVLTLQQEKKQMLQTTQNVADTFIHLNKARGIRNKSMYLSENNLVDLNNKAKDYLFTILEKNSEEYKAISRIKFKKMLTA